MELSTGRKSYFAKLFIFCILSSMFIIPVSSCNSKYAYSSSTVKPVNRSRHYNPKKDKNKKRVKTIRVKT
jgi:hypothetical protein